MSDSNESGKSRLRLKEKLFERVNAPLAEGSTAPTDVYAMLEQNKIIAEAAAKPLEPVTKRSRRMRDYIITMIGGNGAVILAMVFLPKNPVLLTFGFSGIVLISGGITWVMWVVMDDY